MRNLDYRDGMICNWGTHLNDIAQWGAGTERTGPVEIKASGKFHAGKVWNVLESFEAWYKFANGMELFYRMGVPHVRFEGEKGWIHVNYTPDKITHERVQASDPAILKEQIGAEEIHFPLKTEKADFIDAVKSRAARWRMPRSGSAPRRSATSPTFPSSWAGRNWPGTRTGGIFQQRRGQSADRTPAPRPRSLETL